MAARKSSWEQQLCLLFLPGTEQMDSALVPHLTLKTLPGYLAAGQGSGCIVPLYLAASWWTNAHYTLKQTHSKLLSSSSELFKNKTAHLVFHNKQELYKHLANLVLPGSLNGLQYLGTKIWGYLDHIPSFTAFTQSELWFDPGKFPVDLLTPN